MCAGGGAHMTGQRIVIVGSGMAATRLVEELGRPRRTGTRSPCSATSRTRRTTGSCCRRCSRARTAVDAADPAGAARGTPLTAVDLRLGARVLRVDRDRREVMLVDGDARALRPAGPRDRQHPDAAADPRPGRPEGRLHEKVHAFRSLAGLPGLLGPLPGARRAVVVGGGLLGLQVARALSVRGLDDRDRRGRRSPAAQPGRARRRARSSRRDLRDARAPRSTPGPVRCAGDDERADLDNGFVLRGRPGRAHRRRSAGDRPGPRSGLTVRRGIVVDERSGIRRRPACATRSATAPSRGRTTGFVSPAWEQAVVAGHRLAGERRAYAGSRIGRPARARPASTWRSSGTRRAAGPRSSRWPTPCVGSHRKLVVRDGVIVGATLVGDLSRIGLHHAALRPRHGPGRPRARGRSCSATGPAEPPSRSPDDAEVCACAGVTAGRDPRPARRLGRGRTRPARHHRVAAAAPRSVRPAPRRHGAGPGSPPDGRPRDHPWMMGLTRSARRSSSSATAWSATGFVQAAIERGLTEAYDVVVRRRGAPPGLRPGRPDARSSTAGADELSLLADG